MGFFSLILVANLVVATQFFLTSEVLLTDWQTWVSLKQDLEEHVCLAEAECFIAKDRSYFPNVCQFNRRSGILMKILILLGTS